MTIKAGNHIQIFSKDDKVLFFDGENGELCENAEQVLLKMANEDQKLLKSRCNANHGEIEIEKEDAQGVNMEDKRTNVSEDDSQNDKNQMIVKMSGDADCDHLLILAQSAEMMVEYEANPSRRDDESSLLENAGDAGIAGKISAVKQIHEMPAISYRREESRSNGKTPCLTQIQHLARTICLTQIRHIARSRGKFPAQPMIGKHTGLNLQVKKVRLTDIRRLARHNFQMYSQWEEEQQLTGNSGERTIRFSQLKQMACFKRDSPMLKAVHDSIPAHFHCQTCEVGPDHRRAKIIEAIFGVDDSLRVHGEAPEEIISVKDRRKVSQLQA